MRLTIVISLLIHVLIESFVHDIGRILLSTRLALKSGRSSASPKAKDVGLDTSFKTTGELDVVSKAAKKKKTGCTY
jgi:hypothetical protein